MTEPATTLDDLLSRIDTMQRYRRAGKSALFQPVVLLWAIGRARRGAERLLPWPETQATLKELLRKHGEKPRPDRPIAALHRAGIWELRDHEPPVPTAHGGAEPEPWFNRNQPRGGLPLPIYELLRDSESAQAAAIDQIFDTYLDNEPHDELLTDTGLIDSTRTGMATEYARLCRVVERGEPVNSGKRTTRTTTSPFRSACAREAVRLRSAGRCENPGCTGQPEDVTDSGKPLLDVDHIEDLALGGRDHPEQMIALCPNCHRIKTHGSTREHLRAKLREVARSRHTTYS
ncbi:HNH endonuclease signature motif containing protein [Amycolatopsis anabasis]|uniref:HNH endonuclease signature motif containing protein n=1 Tax=Amycolatopsis anabasis TaxID=1840409 RepID=UPI00131C9469|nr:HNH endonuclease signature motif containing protein [Amycolatopsis anabasis]